MPEFASIDFMGQNLLYLLPEGILTLGLLVVLSLLLVTSKKTPEENMALMGTSLAFIVASLLSLGWTFQMLNPTVPQPVMFGTMTSDVFGFLVRMLLLIGAAVSIAIAPRYLEQKTRVIGDFYVLVMGATLGGMFLASSSDLIMAFVGLETLSITSYILAGYFRKTVQSAEASFKYLIYGGMGTAAFLFALSLVYGLVGSTNFTDIAQVLQAYQHVTHPTLVVLMLFLVAALAYKLSIAPFHMWAPDVYEGAPTPVSAFLSVVSKTAAFALTIRILLVLFPGFSQLTTLWVVLAVLSMTIGNLVALKQTNIKRLLAYSTVAHAGYMLLGLVIATPDSIGSILYYLITYLFMNLGAFACAIHFNSLTGSDAIDDYRGLVQKQPLLSLGFSLCLLSLTGIPITAGFFAKFFLFQSVIASGTGYLWLVIVALLNSTISLAYYINVIRLMVVKEPSAAVQRIPSFSRMPMSLSTALTMCVLITVLLGVFASPFYEFSKQSVKQLTQEHALFVSQTR